MKLSDRRQGYLFLLPSAVVLGGLALFPLLWVVALSLQKKLLVLPSAQFVGLENFGQLAQDPRFWNSLSNTLYFTGVSVGLELLLGLGAALLLQKKWENYGWLRAVVLLPWIIPTVVSAKMWEWMYQPRFGLFNYLLGTQINWLGHPGWAIHATIALDVWKTTPFVIILFIAGLQNIPNGLIAAARVDGANAWQIFYRIKLPLLNPMILIVLLFRTLDAFRVFDAVYVLTGGGPANTTETISIYTYRILFEKLQFGYGSALAVVTFLCVLAISLVYIRALKRA